MDNFGERSQKYVELIEQKLMDYLPEAKDGQDIVRDAMRYSLMNPGKRIRPILALEFCRICGGDMEDALPFACAVEMIHCYSLIHDDLPCMDDDDMRRGKPSCHIEFGEAYALLAGDALLTLAFETMLGKYHQEHISAETAAKACLYLAAHAGIGGMIGGQVIDLMAENKKVDLTHIKRMDQLKTGALISAAAVMGCMVANADEDQIKAAQVYTQNLGLAFQIVDDILDMTGDESELGKPIGSDSQNQKSTYVSLMGLEASQKMADELTEQAVNALSAFEKDTEYLTQLARELACRRK